MDDDHDDDDDNHDHNPTMSNKMCLKKRLTPVSQELKRHSRGPREAGAKKAQSRQDESEGGVKWGGGEPELKRHSRGP
eukprot:5407550-Karenia_brevis.AAC.1